jgi:hypothetical protein
MEKRLEAFSKEAGQARALQSRIAQLENARQQAQQAPQTNSNLTPDQQAQANLKAFVLEAFKEKYGNLLTFGEQQIQQAKEYEEVTNYRADLVDLAKEFDVPFQEVNPIMVDIVTKLDAARQSGDPVATAQLARILGNGGQNYLFTLAVREREKQVQGQAQQFQQGKAKVAQAASQTMRSTTQVPASNEKSLDQLTPGDVSKMSETEIDELLDQAGVR